MHIFIIYLMFYMYLDFKQRFEHFNENWAW